jgi:endo-1,4-beta-xylanase
MHFTSLLVAASAFVTALAAPVAEPVENGLASLVERSTPAGTGQNNGYYYSFWNAGKSISTHPKHEHALTIKRWRYRQLQQQGCW